MTGPAGIQMVTINESMRYALDGIKLAQKEKDKGAESKLLFCIGENKWQLSFQEEAYGLF